MVYTFRGIVAWRREEPLAEECNDDREETEWKCAWRCVAEFDRPAFRDVAGPAARAESAAPARGHHYHRGVRGDRGLLGTDTHCPVGQGETGLAETSAG